MGDKYLSILPGYQFGLASKYRKWKYLKEDEESDEYRYRRQRKGPRTMMMRRKRAWRSPPSGASWRLPLPQFGLCLSWLTPSIRSPPPSPSALSPTALAFHDEDDCSNDDKKDFNEYDEDDHLKSLQQLIVRDSRLA